MVVFEDFSSWYSSFCSKYEGRSRMEEVRWYKRQLSKKNRSLTQVKWPI